MPHRVTPARRVVEALAIVALAILLSEVVLQSVMTHLLGQGRLFERDAVLGWKTRPNLDVTRRNPEGEWWNVRTGPCGFRSACDWPPDSRNRLLVLGDSFAFGEGVPLEDRFDTELARRQPVWSVVNAGVMGYGTDQEILAARALMDRLNSKDAVVVLVYGNDFFDILRKRFAGRPKPWFEWKGSTITEHPPVFSWLDRFRDRSYIAAALGRLTEPRLADSSDEARESALRLFRAMLERDLTGPKQRAVRIILARHGMSLVTEDASADVRTQLDDTWRALCAGISCVDLDPALTGIESQPDGHWSAEGHRVVGGLLARAAGDMRLADEP